MTINEIKCRVAEIASLAGDDEKQHSMEDALYRAVLFGIADGEDNARECAAEAIKAAALKFERWCA